MKPSILITGGAGYIGSHSAFLLAHNRYHVIILDLMLHGQPHNFAWATIVHGDYGDRALLETIFTQYRIDTVIHCGAFIEVGASVHHPMPFYDNNVVKTITLLEAMRAHGIKKIIFSSSRCTGHRARLP